MVPPCSRRDDVSVDVDCYEVRSADKIEVRAGYGHENPKRRSADPIATIVGLSISEGHALSA
jgi:hypothetical protein